MQNLITNMEKLLKKKSRKLGERVTLRTDGGENKTPTKNKKKMRYKKATNRALALSSSKCTSETLPQEWLSFFESHSSIKEFPCACGQIVAHGYFYINKKTKREICMGQSCENCLKIPKEFRRKRKAFNMLVYGHHGIKREFWNGSTEEYEKLVKAYVDDYVEKLILHGNIKEIQKFRSILESVYIRDMVHINNSIQILNDRVRQHWNDLEQAERKAELQGLCNDWIGHPY